MFVHLRSSVSHAFGVEEAIIICDFLVELFVVIFEMLVVGLAILGGQQHRNPGPGPVRHKKDNWGGWTFDPNLYPSV